MLACYTCNLRRGGAGIQGKCHKLQTWQSLHNDARSLFEQRTTKTLQVPAHPCLANKGGDVVLAFTGAPGQRSHVKHEFTSWAFYSERTKIAITNDVGVDRGYSARSPELPQKELGTIMGSQIAGIAPFDCNAALLCLVCDGHHNRKSQASLRCQCSETPSICRDHTERALGWSEGDNQRTRHLHPQLHQTLQPKPMLLAFCQWPVSKDGNRPMKVSASWHSSCLFAVSNARLAV